MYRLIEAKGRELKGTASFGNEDNWNDALWMGQPQPGNSSAVQAYTQHYTYDAVGNILSLQHIAGTGSYTRTYDVATASNKLLSTTVGSNTYHYTHDVRGNMLTMPHLQAMGWNALNELYTITQGTTVANYQYNGGQRVRKYVDKGNIKEERIYLGSYEIYRKFDQASSLIIERTTVHVSDDTGRIAMLEARTYGTAAEDNNTAQTLTRYIYSNHLQSSALELDESAAIISYEEYHPYGTTSYQAMNAAIKAVAKRYRYTGKERDEETGLYYHGARYYIPWLARWSASDPLESKYAGVSPYNYGFNNPVKWTDSTGMGPDDPEQYEGKPVKYTQRVEEEGVYNVKVGYDKNTGAYDIELSSQKQAVVEITGERIPYNFSLLKSSYAPVDTRDGAIKYYADKLNIAARMAQEAAVNKAQMEKAQMMRNIYLDQRFIGEQNGQAYNVSRRELAQAEYRRNEEWGESLRSGNSFTAIGTLFGGRDLGMKLAPLGNLAMAFSSVGTPYGKVEPVNPVESPSIAYTGRTIAGSSTLPSNIASTFMGGKYTSRVLEQDAYFYRAGEFNKPYGSFYSMEAPQGILQVRIDKAIPLIWHSGEKSIINTGFSNMIPKGTTIYEGLTAPQGGIFLGGTPQIYIPPRLGVTPIFNYPLK